MFRGHVVAIYTAPERGAPMESREGVEATVRAYGGDLQHGFAASRDGPRTITRWTSAMRNAMNAAPGHRMLLANLRHAALSEDGRLQRYFAQRPGNHYRRRVA